MKNKIFLMLFIIAGSLYSYPWPIRPFNQVHNVIATLGDYRKGITEDPHYPRFHNGADIQASENTDIFSIESGECKWSGTKENEGVRVSDYAYIHLKNRYPKGLPVVGIADTSTTDEDPNNDHPTKIGETNDLNHLHFAEGPAGGPYQNPLREDEGLDGYSDNNLPVVLKPAFFPWGIELQRERIERSPDALWGKVEIRAKMRDITNCGDNSGVYMFAYSVVKKQGSVVHSEISGIFDQVTPPNDGNPVPHIYDTTLSRHAQSVTFHYWLTNPIIDHQVNNRYWNTKLKQGQAWNGSEALIDREAAYKDGWYRVWALGYDIRLNGGDTLNRKGADFTDVLLDNFVPYVYAVMVTRKGELVYNAMWLLNDTQDGLVLDKRNDENVSPGDRLTFKIYFSEEMDTHLNAIKVTLKKSSNELDIDDGARWIDKKTWEGSVTIPKDFGKGKAVINISCRDLAGHLLDKHPGTIATRDGNGNWQRYEEGIDVNHKLYIGEAPIVTNTDPSDNATDVPIDKNITIVFSKRMDSIATERAVLVVSEDGSDSVDFTPFWSKNYDTLELRLRDELKYCIRYIGTVSDTAISKEDSIQLDGDEDGLPGGNYEFTFMTEEPEVLVFKDSMVAHLRDGESVNSKVITAGWKLKDTVECEIQFFVNNPGGWSVINANNEGFLLPPKNIHKNSYTVLNNNGKRPLNVLYDIRIECVNESGEGYYWTSESHEYDHSDENQSPGVTEYPTPWIISTSTSGATLGGGTGASPSGLPDIGILLSGWADGYGHILGRYGISTLPVKPDLKIINHPEIDIKDSVKLLVIGSAGLAGLNTPTFKQKLEEYVRNGGNLLVFTPRYGSELEVLPGNVGGYGWNEDQSCFWRGAYLNKWHPIFAGQKSPVMDCNIDGYFYEVPENSEFLLCRVRNALPALFTYKYGAGTIILSSLYSDWSYGHNQCSQGELNLLRDLTTWAVNPDMEIPEFYKDSAVAVPVSIKYTANDTVRARAAIIKVYTPDRVLYDSIVIPISLERGEETEWTWSKSSIPENLGLWVIDYALKDENGNWIQGYNRGAVFAQKIDIPIGSIYTSRIFEMEVISDKREVLIGDTVNFQIKIKNKGEYPFPGKLIIGVDEVEGGWKVIDSILGVTIPSDSEIIVEYTRSFYISSDVYFGLYQNQQVFFSRFFRNTALRRSKSVGVISKPFSLFIYTDKSNYVLGVDSVNYKIEVENRLPKASYPFVNLYILQDYFKHIIWSDTLELLAKEKKEIKGAFSLLDFDIIEGKKKLCCELFFRDSLWNFASRSFEVTYPQVKCSFILPDSFQYGGSNLFSVRLSASGWLPPGKLLVRGVSFSDSIIYLDSIMIENTIDTDTTLIFNYQPELWSTRSALKAQYRYINRYIKRTAFLEFYPPIVSSFRPVYSDYQEGFIPEDTAVFKAWVSLKGDLYGVPLEFSLWSDYLGKDTLRDTIILNPTTGRTITLKDFVGLEIPADTMIPYSYRWKYLDRKGESIGKLQYFVQSPEAVLHWPLNDTFSIGASIPITFTNSIKSPSRVDIKSVSLYGGDAVGNIVENFDGPGVVEIPGEGSYTFNITVPQWKSGQYYLSVEASIVEGRGVNLNSYPYGCPIYIDGLTANIQVSTSKKYYGQGDEIPFSSVLENGGYGWNGAETLKVARMKDTLESFSIWDLTDTGSVETFGLIPDSSGGYILAPEYTLECVANLPYMPAEDSFLVVALAVDEYDNLWVMSASCNGNKIFLRKWDRPFGNLLAEFSVSIPMIGWNIDMEVHQGVIYISSPSSGVVYRLNANSGEIIGYIHPPGGGFFMAIGGIEVKDNGNILVLDKWTRILWEFSSSGDSISTFVLPVEFEDPYGYGFGLEYKDGVIYLADRKKIITIEGTSVDSFGLANYANYMRISLSDNGKLAATLCGEGCGLNIFSPQREFEVGGGVFVQDFCGDITFYKNYIVREETDEEHVVVNDTIVNIIYYNNLYLYREFGKDNGMLKVSEFPDAPWKYKFHNYRNIDIPNSGSISYQVLDQNATYPSDDNLLPLSSMIGSDCLLPIYITMEGNYENSPVFYDLLLNLKTFVSDSVIVKNTYPLSLSPYESVSFADTIRDTVPPGDYIVSGDAYSNYPQHITSDWKSFTVIGDNVALLLNSNKEEGFVGEEFRINPLTINPLPEIKEPLHLIVKGYFGSLDTTYLDTTFMLNPQSLDSFPFVIRPQEPIVIRAELALPSGDTLRREFIPVVKNTRLLSLQIFAPDVVDLSPFTAKTEIYNYSFSPLSLEVKRIFGADTLINSLTLGPKETYTFVDSFSTVRSDTLKVIAITGGESFTKKKFIDCGIKGIVLLDSLFEVSPDSVRMNGIVRNEGLYPLSGKVLFCLIERTKGLIAHSLQLSATGFSAERQQVRAEPFPTTLSAQQVAISSVARVGKDLSLSAFISQLQRAGVDTSLTTIYLPMGKSDTVPIAFNRHNPGNYELLGFLFAETTPEKSVMLDSSSSIVNIVGNNQVFVDSIFVSPTCDSTGSVLLWVTLSNRSYAPFSGNLIVSSPICYFDSLITLPIKMQDTIVFFLKEPIDEGRYYFTGALLEGGFSVNLKSQVLEFHPIYHFDSLPNLEFSVPDSGMVEISISNIGNGKGERTVAVNFVDVLNINRDAEIKPGSSEKFSGSFYIPEDFPGGKYWASAEILKNSYPEVDTLFPVQVNGIRIEARDSLDKPVYSPEDTAKLSIIVKNNSLFSGELLSIVRYGELELDTTFILGGMEKGVLNKTNRDTLYLDASGVYLTDPIELIGYDSVTITRDGSDSLVVQIRTDSLIGKGIWTTITDSITYPISKWLQLKIENREEETLFLNSINLDFKPSGSLILDSFPSTRKVLSFNLPVNRNEKKLGWGIYNPSGRSLVLDERYVYIADSLLTIYTDKSRYEMLDTVRATLIKHFADTSYLFNYRVYFSPKEEIKDSFKLRDDTMRFEFVIPNWTRSGTYTIDYLVYKNGLKAQSLQLSGRGLSVDSSQLSALGGGRFETPLAKQWVLGKPLLSSNGKDVFLSGEHPFDVNGITVYFKNAKMDTNFYHNGEIAKVWMDIFSDIDLAVHLNISSTGSSKMDISLSLKKDIPNHFEFTYPIEGCKRGTNELYLHLEKDSVSLAGTVLRFDVYVADTTAPVISVLKEPSNTYSSNRFYELIARIYEPELTGTPFTDTLYYRIASSGGSSWNALSAHSVKGDTNRYLIPSHPNGTHIEYHLIARDEFGNIARYPKEGERDFWVLSALKPSWQSLTYSNKPSVILNWDLPRDLIYYHCGLHSDTVSLSDIEFATRFTPQFIPAKLNRIGIEFIDEGSFIIDTLKISLYYIGADLLPGVKIDSFVFVDSFYNGYKEIELPGIEVPKEGIFVGIKGSKDLYGIFDGFGEGSHTVKRSENSWEFRTPGELLINGMFSHPVGSEEEKVASLVSFGVYRSSGGIWERIAYNLKETSYTDTTIQADSRYSYKIMGLFINPVDSFFSISDEVFVDLTPPELDTVLINKVGDEILIKVFLEDPSGVVLDCLGYLEGGVEKFVFDTLDDGEYFFTLSLTEDTLRYFFFAEDKSLLRNKKRFPEIGYYKWWEGLSGITEIPDSTYLFRVNTVIMGDLDLRYALSKKERVSICLFDIAGRKAKILVDRVEDPGYYSIPLKASTLPSGIYFLKMETEDYRKTVKLVRIR
ncbi:MAG: Ig-like domain-containing protein [candidate division WOR-3 bacterium]